MASVEFVSSSIIHTLATVVNDRQQKPATLTIKNIHDERSSAIVVPTEGSVIIQKEFELNQSKASNMESVVSEKVLLDDMSSATKNEKVEDEHSDPVFDLDDRVPETIKREDSSSDFERADQLSSHKETPSEGQLSMPIESKSEENLAFHPYQMDSEHEEEASPVLFPDKTEVHSTRLPSH